MTDQGSRPTAQADAISALELEGWVVKETTDDGNVLVARLGGESILITPSGETRAAP